MGRIQKLSQRRESFRADPRRFLPSKRILAGSGKIGAVEKDSGPFQKVWPRPRRVFSLEKRREAPNQLAGAAVFFAGTPEEAERCDELPGGTVLVGAPDPEIVAAEAQIRAAQLDADMADLFFF